MSRGPKAEFSSSVRQTTSLPLVVKKSIFHGLAAATLFVMSSASAQSTEDAIQAFDEGRFLEAAGIAEALGTSEGYVWASRSLTIYGHYLASFPEERQEILLQAIEFAKKAVELDQSNPHAYQEMAHSEGRYADSLPITEALNSGYVEKTLASMQRALKIDPDFAYAHLAIGRWHARIIDVAGFMGALIFGASEDKAHKHFDCAIDLLPDDIVVLANSAIGLLQLDDHDNREQVRDFLARINAMPDKNAYEQILQEEVNKRLAALDAS